MIRRLSIVLLALLLIMTVPAAGFAQSEATPPLQTIMLKDGTVLKGRLVNMDSEHYWIATEMFGTVQIPESNLLSLMSAEAAAQQQAPAAMPEIIRGKAAADIAGLPGLQGLPGLGQLGDLQGLQKSLLNDPQLRERMNTLMNDPAIMDLINDEKFQQQIFSFDLENLQSNPRMQDLINNPEFQALIQQLTGQLMPAMNGSALFTPPAGSEKK